MSRHPVQPSVYPYWLKSLRNEEQIKFHVALTPTWNESAYFADYVLPMGHAGERHDLMSQETHAGMWIGFRQPVRRVALERAGRPVRFTHEANPGEVWEDIGSEGYCACWPREKAYRPMLPLALQREEAAREICWAQKRRQRRQRQAAALAIVCRV